MQRLAFGKREAERFLALYGFEEKLRTQVVAYCRENKIKMSNCNTEIGVLYRRFVSPLNLFERLDEFADIETNEEDIDLGMRMYISNLDRDDYSDVSIRSKLLHIYHNTAKYVKRENRLLSEEDKEIILVATCEVLNKFFNS